MVEVPIGVRREAAERGPVGTEETPDVKDEEDDGGFGSVAALRRSVGKNRETKGA